MPRPRCGRQPFAANCRRLVLAAGLSLAPAHAALDVTIGTSATTGGYFQFGRWYPTASPCHIHVNDLIAELGDRNVRIDSANASFGEPGDVIFATTVPVDNLPTTIARTLTINAQRNIAINGAISQEVPGGDDSPNPLNLVLNGNLSGSGGGGVANAGTLNTAGGAITISAASWTLATGVVMATGGGALNASLSGSINLGGGLINTSGAPFAVTAGTTGAIAADVFTDGGSLSLTTTGNLMIDGTLDARHGANTGSVSVRSTGGTLTLSAPAEIRAGAAGTTTARAAQGVTVACSVNGSSVWVEAEGGASDAAVTASGSLASSNGSVTVRAGNHVAVSGPVTANGAVEVTADSNLGGSGTATIAAAVGSQNHALTITGAAVAVNSGSLLSNGGNVTLQAPGGPVTIAGEVHTTGGKLQVSGATYSLSGLVTSSGGSVTFNGVGSGSINNDIFTSGGDLTLSISGVGATLSKTLGSSLETSGGAGTSKVRILAPEGSLGPWRDEMVAGTGGVEITVSGALTLVDEIRSNGGQVNVIVMESGALLRVEGPVRATGAGSISLRSNAGPLQLASTASLQAGTTVALHGQQGVIIEGDIPAAGTVDVDCGTGNIAIGATAAISNSGPLVAFDTANSTITVAAGAAITPGPTSKLRFKAGGSANSLVLAVPLASGSGGIELVSDHDVQLTSTLTTTGPVDLLADADSSGVGALSTGAIFGDAQPVILRGNGITVGGLVNTTTGEIRVQPAPATTAGVTASLDGPTRLVSGITRFMGGNVTGGSLTVADGAVLEFDGPSRTLAPAGFIQHGAQGETRLRIGSPSQFNRILSSGPFTAGGKLVVQFEAGYGPAAGHSFQVVGFTSSGGSFANTTLPGLAAGLAWDTSRLLVDGTLRILSHIDAWRQQHFGTSANSGDAADDADPDSDDLANLLEYAFGLDPTSPSRQGLPEAGTVEVAGRKHLTLALVRPLEVHGLSYRFRAGPDLPATGLGSLYSTNGDIPNSTVTTEVSRETLPGNLREKIVVRDNTAIGDAPARFMHIEVSRP